MKSVLFVVVVCGLLSACMPMTEGERKFAEKSIYDQCRRAELFQQCMKALPAGPMATKYNDWNEVVSECGDQARMMSVRKESAVKEECRS